MFTLSPRIIHDCSRCKIFISGVVQRGKDSSLLQPNLFPGPQPFHSEMNQTRLFCWAFHAR